MAAAEMEFPDEEDMAAEEAAATESPAHTLSFAKKHPLQYRWVLWFDNPKLKKAEESWEENLKQIHTFDTVEDFWCLFNNVVAPTKLSMGSNFHIFKEGVLPMWEDSTNKDGGKWVLSIPKQRRKSVDLWWMYIVLIMIGENFEDQGDVCGVVVSLRKSQDRIALWTKSALQEKLQMAIGSKIRTGLELPRAIQIKYQSHADAYASGSSFQNKVHYEV